MKNSYISKYSRIIFISYETQNKIETEYQCFIAAKLYNKSSNNGIH